MRAYGRASQDVVEPKWREKGEKREQRFPNGTDTVRWPHFEPAQTVAGLQTQCPPAATESGSHPPATGAARTPAIATAIAARTHAPRMPEFKVRKIEKLSLEKLFSSLDSPLGGGLVTGLVNWF